MSILKQLLVCLVLAGAAAAGWYGYTHPETIGLARASGSGEGAGGERAGGERRQGRQGQGEGGSRAQRVPGLVGERGAVNVVTSTVETDAGGETLVALGTAEAARSVTLFPEVTGIVTEILFQPGQMVEAGTVLLRLKDDEQQVALDKAGVTLQQARQTLERSRTLAKTKNITVVALSEAETAAQLAEIEVRAAEIDLDRRSIEAPFAGVTGLTDLSVGDLVATTNAVTTLDDLATLQVAFEAPERWAGRVSQDQPIVATAQALPGAEFPGRITGIDSRIDKATRTLRLQAELANEGGALKTGMAVNVALQFTTDRQLAVPTLAVQWDRRGSFVWKIENGAARRAEIAIFRRQSGIVIVEGDIAAGDVIVVEGIQRLREGAAVAEVDVAPTIMDADGKPAAEPVPAADAGGPAGVRG